MAQLKDLIVYGDTKFLGDVTLDHDPTAALHAATKAYVDAQVGTGTDEKLKVAALTSGTEYLPILAVSSDSSAAATRQIDKNAQAFKYVCTPGTSGGAGGTAQLILGNSINSGYVNSATGILTLYGASIYGVDIKYNGAYIGQTLLVPGPTANDQTNYFVTKVGSAAIGAADQPVYVDALGHAVLGNKNPWGVGGTDANRPGVYYPNFLTGSFGSGTITLAEIESDGSTILNGVTNTGTSSFMMASWTSQALTESHPAGSTTYTMNGELFARTNWLNIPFVQSQAPYSLVYPTSQTSDSSGNPVLTFSTTLNPTSAVSSIRYTAKNTGANSLIIGMGANTGRYAIMCGSANYNAGYANTVLGRNNSATGSGTSNYANLITGEGNTVSMPLNLVGGRVNTVSGAANLVCGQNNIVPKNMSLVVGNGNDISAGPSTMAVVGKFSIVSADTRFAVGNGNSETDRANAFEVHTDGRATVGADPTANLDVATKQYVDGLTGAWGLTSQGGAVYPASMKSISTLPAGNIAVLGDGYFASDLAKVTSEKTGNVIIWGNVSNAIVSAPAGSTSYTINSATYTMPDGSTEELSELYFFIEDSVAPQKPTSVTFNTDNKPVLTFASSLNPTAENTHIYVGASSERHANLIVGYGATSIKDASVIVGNFLYNGGTNSLIAGQKDVNTGSVSSLVGVRLKNTKNGSFLAGSDNYNNSNMYSALIGQGHYNTSGPVGTTAVGKYSTITSTTQFVVGNGTSASARSNAFEVTTTGEAKAVSFTENGTSLVNKYAAKTHTHGDISSTGIITTNPGVTIASGDALLIADSSVGDAIKKTAITFGTSTTTYLRNDGTWGTPSSGDTKVTQTAVTGTGTTSQYPILLAYGAGQTATATNTANFTANASVTPSGDIYGNTFHYGANAYTQYNSTLKAIEFCFA